MTPITTNLAQSQQLKKWGAPQDTFLSLYKTRSGTTVLTLTGTNTSPHDIVSAYDLQSLIEWLGDDFQVLENHTVGGDNHWVAGVNNDEYPFTFTEGESPLEAIFNLCEAIHGKEQK